MFNYSREKHLFEEKWKATRKKYKKLGMSEETIDALYDFDLKWFCNRRTYQNRTDISDEKSINNDICADIFEHEKLSVNFNEENFLSRYAWVETLSNTVIINILKSLPEDDLELLTLHVIYGLSQSSIAKKFGCNQSVISRKIKRILFFLQSMS